VELLIVGGFAGVAVLCLCMPALMKAETRRKRRKDPRYRPPGSLGVIDEIFHPTAYSAFQEIESHKEVPAPAPAPGDPDRLGRR
jgi:hypothetical protein